MILEFFSSLHPINLLIFITTTIFLITFLFKSSKSKLNKKINDQYISITSSLPSTSESTSTIKVMSYNIMAFQFTKLDWYTYCNRNFLYPKYRCPRIIEEIESLNADIICLQEVDVELYKEFYKVNLEKLGYECVITLTNTYRTVTLLTGYKKDKFRVISTRLLDLNNDLEKIDESFVKYKEAQILKLERKVLVNNSQSEVFVIVNTHLFWNPDYEYIKYGQFAYILKTLSMSEELNPYPIIFSSDLNSLPWSNLMRFALKTPANLSNSIKGDVDLNIKFIEAINKEYSHDLKLRSAYDCYKGNIAKDAISLEMSEGHMTDDLFNRLADEHPMFTNYNHDFNGCLDYIFYTFDKLRLVSLLKVPNDEYIKHNALPNEVYPSDHLKICAEFVMKI